jgi:hypothetical protein
VAKVFFAASGFVSVSLNYIISYALVTAGRKGENSAGRLTIDHYNQVELPIWQEKAVKKGHRDTARCGKDLMKRNDRRPDREVELRDS